MNFISLSINGQGGACKGGKRAIVHNPVWFLDSGRVLWHHTVNPDRCKKADMENYKLVLPEHLNHYGFLFGGNLLKWVDETAWIAASQDYAGCNFVTIAMDKVEFRKNVRQGAILRINAERSRVGNTSVQYTVSVFAGNIDTGTEETAFSTNITFVRVDSEGRKMNLPAA